MVWPCWATVRATWWVLLNSPALFSTSAKKIPLNNTHTSTCVQLNRVPLQLTVKKNTGLWNNDNDNLSSSTPGSFLVQYSCQMSLLRNISTAEILQLCRVVELLPGISPPVRIHYILKAKRGKDHGQVVPVISHFSCALWVKMPLSITSLHLGEHVGGGPSTCQCIGDEMAGWLHEEPTAVICIHT